MSDEKSMQEILDSVAKKYTRDVEVIADVFVSKGWPREGALKLAPALVAALATDGTLLYTREEIEEIEETARKKGDHEGYQRCLDEHGDLVG